MNRSVSGRRYRLELLGPFRLTDPGGRRVRISSRKGMALIGMLATAPTGERTRAWLQEQLWGSRGEAQAQASLRSELANLRIVLDAPGAGPLLTTGRDRVQLDLDKVLTDIRDSPGAAGTGSVPAGEFLEGLDIAGEEGFEDWLRVQRRYFAERAAEAPARGGKDVAGRSVTSPRISVATLLGANHAHATVALAERCLGDIRIALLRTSTVDLIVPEQSAEPRSDLVASCAALGANYLCEVDIRALEGRIHATLTLTECLGRRQLWADTISCNDEPSGRLGTIAAARLVSALERAEMERASAAAASDPPTLFFQADALFRRWDRESMLESITLAERAVASDPRNRWALALAAFCHGVTYTGRWSDDPERSREIALDLFEQSMRHGADEPQVLGFGAGTLLTVGGDLDLADRLVERGLEVSPDSPPVLFWGGWVDVVRGQPQRGRERFEAMLLLNPVSNVRPFALAGLGLCFLALDEPDQAVLPLIESTQRVPTFAPALAGLAVALTRVGRIDEAERALGKLRDAGGLDAVAVFLRDGALLREIERQFGTPATSTPAPLPMTG